MKQILRNLGLIILCFILVAGLTLWWLNLYTMHGKHKVLPSYIDQPLEEAAKDARKNDFTIHVIDSSFRVGVPGGMILNQQPAPASKVKKNRKIYVTITKYDTEKVALQQLPDLYGQNFERRKKLIKQSYEIECKIVGYEYDPGLPNHILKVLYNGETIVTANKKSEDVMIEKGGVLEMILSKNTGARVEMPDLVCRAYDEALFLLSGNELNYKIESSELPSEQYGDGFITDQIPSPQNTVYSGDTVTLYISKEKPVSCGN